MISRYYWLLFIALSLSAVQTLAADEDPAPAPVEVVLPAVPAETITVSEAPTLRPYPFSLMGQVSYFGIAVPTKYGVALTWRIDERWAIEPSYFSGSYGISNRFIDLGNATETLFILDARYFAFHSFNLIFGLSEQKYVAHLGSEIMNQVSSSYPQGLDVVNVNTLGLQLGLGNRWSYRRFVFGADWLLLNFPFITLDNDAPVLNGLSDSPARTRIDQVLQIMRYLPTGALLKIALGFSF